MNQMTNIGGHTDAHTTDRLLYTATQVVGKIAVHR